jgi:hypothetical protein
VTTTAAPDRPPGPPPGPSAYGLLPPAVLAACLATPTPYAGAVWGAVVVVIVVLAMPVPLRRWV